AKPESSRSDDSRPHVREAARAFADATAGGVGCKIAASAPSRHSESVGCRRTKNAVLSGPLASSQDKECLSWTLGTNPTFSGLCAESGKYQDRKSTRLNSSHVA